MRGKFITFEGGEGVGKTTQVAMLKEYLDKTRQKYVFLREPGGAQICEKIRKIILDVNNKEMVDECESMLYCASRAQLVGQVIKPTLEEGITVICDRFIDSTFAYQGVARGLGADYVDALNQAAIRGILPDITIFLDLDPEEAFKRKGGADATDRLEVAGLEFHKKVYLGYKMAQERYPNRIISIDSHGTAEEIHKRVVKCLKEHGMIE